jgi:hypothetical protein
MLRAGPGAVALVAFCGWTIVADATAPILTPCDELPSAVAALGPASSVESYGLAPAVSIAVASITATPDGGRSVLRFARGGDAPEDVKLAGRVPGIAVTPDGKTAYAIVRVVDRKGGLRNVDLVRIDLETARAGVVASLPATARGLALGGDGASLLVASRDEIRTFVFPSLTSGPLYRAIGDNVGVAPLPGSSYVLLAQSSRVVLADLAAPQDRDGLVLAQETSAPAPLRGLLDSAGDAGPIALADGGRAWCVRAEPPASSPPKKVEPPPETPPAAEPPPVVAAAAAAALAEPPPPAQPPVTSPPREPPAVASPPQEPPSVTPSPEESPPVASPPQEPPPEPGGAAEPGTVFGTISGPAMAEVTAVVLLGPDNVLREAARAIPDEQGRYKSAALPPGSYRLIAAGKRGRVLICNPPFISLKVASNGAVEAPVLKVLSAQ